MHRGGSLVYALVVALPALLCSSLATAAPDAAEAARLFAEARDLCERDAGKLWGQSLCGPILYVDYTDRATLANQKDAAGNLEPDGAMFRGVLPDDVIIANTPTEWAGTRWTQILAPAPTDAAKRHVLLAHELFHRIQPALGLTRPEAANHHLDTLDGRYYLQLEWRALAHALEARTAATRRAAVIDALAFRHERYRLFATAAAEEAALEIAEGVPEYTGVKLGLTDDRARSAFAVYDLAAFVPAPTFVRSFAYATGPAYGLLLDGVDRHWRDRLNTGSRLDELLATALKLQQAATVPIAARAARYDAVVLRASEVRRDAERQERLARLKARLVDGPVLILPLAQSNFQFNPQTLVPLAEYGTVYPTLRLTDEWGTLEVEQGALVASATHRATVSLTGADPSYLAGDGWRLKLTSGWHIEKGDRAGDLKLVRATP